MDSTEVITEEQRKRSETNRIAAIARRQASSASQFNVPIVTASNSKPATTSPNPWRLFKCRKLSSNLPNFTKPESPSIGQGAESRAPIENFLARVEICSPDSFCITTLAVQDCKYPGESQCLKKLKDCLSNFDPSRYTQDQNGGKACVYKLTDYHTVLKCLKNCKNIEVEEIPWSTFNVVERLSCSFNLGRWNPCRPEHLSDDKVDELIRNLPKSFLDFLMPFQMEGLKFALQRGGRCLIADEMGLGKTLQAIAVAGCFRDEGSILVVCPAILRYSWAEELERWFPFCVPTDIHLVFSHQNNPANLPKLPKIVVTSYTMLKRLQKSMLKHDWAFLIVDESHHVRCTRKATEPEEIKVVIDLASRIKRIVLLSGTPSLSRPYDMFHQIDMLWPGLLGRTKYDFARTYCDVEPRGCSNFTDFSKGIRLQELNVLLKQTVMIRRLKQHVLMQLPPKRRQIIRLTLKRLDIASAITAVRTCSHRSPSNIDQSAANDVQCDTLHTSSWNLSFQELGIAKLSGFREWLSLHPIAVECDGCTEFNEADPLNFQKMLIFAHHHKVLDGIQHFLCEKEIAFIRIDGNTLAKDRQSAVRLFQTSKEVRIAIIGVTAACVGLDFSVAQHVVFLELPQTPSVMLQAEDRAHRRGQSAAVNIYVFCAKDTIDESHWQTLNRSLLCVSSATDGKYDAVHGITVHEIANFEENSGKENVELPRAREEIDGGQIQTDDLYVNDAVSSAQDGEHNTTEFSGEVQQSDSVCGVLCGVLFPKLDEAKECKMMEQDDNGHSQPIIADESCSAEMNSFRFEVSQYTGRIHLYSVSERDTRPAALFQSVRVEEASSLQNVSNKKAELQFITENLPLRDALLTFVDEWNTLRPIERRKLTGKPLQLPLAIELCCMKESMNHSSQGLLKCGSKQRTTPLSDISNPLPHGAIWKNVCLCSGHGKKEKMYKQGWNLLNEPLCKLCQIPCKSNTAKTPEFFEDLFCSLDCYAEYRLRTSHQFLRQELFQIENGVCSNCKLDCHKLVKSLKFLPLEKRHHCIERVAPRIAERESLREKLVNDPIPGNAWHADHIIPVFRGGGECRLENLRTLCVACHYDVTTAQLAERRLERAKAKQQLKLILQGLNHSKRLSEMGQFEVVCNEHLDLPAKLDDELLVEVPGSAYCEEPKEDNDQILPGADTKMGGPKLRAATTKTDALFRFASSKQEIGQVPLPENSILKE